MLLCGHKLKGWNFLRSAIFLVLAAMILGSATRLLGMELSERDFPLSPHLRMKVRFWERVFRDTSTQSYVIHDVDIPGKIVDIVDFSKLAEKYRLRRPMSGAQRKRIAEKYLSRYALGIDRFRQHGRSAVKFGMIEDRLMQVYLQDPLLFNKLLAGRVRLRLQAGLKEEFLAATRRAESYLPFIEAAFREKGVPVALSRLAFVESMFNLGAVSKVGASGIWQFMPATARHYLHVNQLVDERVNPYKASIAAAKLLKDNHKLLGSWPLAVTAYNHGTKSLQGAVRQLRTNDLDRIVRLHQSPSFGFASKNFYAEFVAVNRVYGRWLKDGTVKKPSRAAAMVALELGGGMSVPQMIEKFGLSTDFFREFAPEISSKAHTALKYKPLPKGYKVYMPSKQALALQKAMVAYGRKGRKENGL